MQIQVRYYAEITIKSRPVRKRLCRKLAANLRRQLGSLGVTAQVNQGWDRILVQLPEPTAAQRERVLACLERTSGVAWFSPLVSLTFASLDDITRQVVDAWAGRLGGKRFAVRCRRRGAHSFRSLDVERAVGAALLAAAPGARVDLSQPQQTVRIELHDQRLLVAGERRDGPGGYPAGCFDPVLSLVSGGFDSMVASWLSMRRGLVTHMCLFRLGGDEHEKSVAQIAYFLWLHYGGGVPVRFVSVPFEAVLEDIGANVDASLITVILKRRMLAAASQLARRIRARALVTGESLAQVSSQTLDNLEVIDSAAELMVMRPLVLSGKQEIIGRARSLGLESMVASIPEYCGAVAVNPTTRARLDRVLAAEAVLDAGLFDAALGKARVDKISLLGGVSDAGAGDGPEVEPVVQTGEIVIDVRHPLEAERRPLRLELRAVLEIPFYALAQRYPDLAQDKRYLLYCDQGVLSRLQAQQLMDMGYTNVAVLRPE